MAWNSRAHNHSKNHWIVLLHVLLVLYSFSSVCGKLAAGFPVLSTGFILCYGAMLALLGIYAIGWQQIIKRLPLTFAYANRAMTVIWGIIWGLLLFGERLTPLKVLGALVVLAGVVLYVVAEYDSAGTDADFRTKDRTAS